MHAISQPFFFLFERGSQQISSGNGKIEMFSSAGEALYGSSFTGSRGFLAGSIGENSDRDSGEKETLDN